MEKIRGVSLVELSIVLLIIALLVGIVAGGQSIQKSSELRGIISQVEDFRVAIDSFYEKYDSLPGDMSDAHTYWDDGANGTCGTATQCNGDEDGSIEWSATANDNETFRAWQHLSLAGLTSMSYNGLGNQGTPDINIPATKRTPGGFFLMTFTDSTNEVNGTYLEVAGFSSTTRPQNKLLTPVEAFTIDEKMDDGVADSGFALGRYSHNGTSWQTATCLSGTSPNRTYNRARSDIECVLFFKVNTK